MKLSFKFLGKQYALQFLSRTIKNDMVAGYTNRCKDGFYITTLDYDNLELGWVVNELRRLQYQFFMGDFYVFKSGENNFHAVCFDKITLSQFVDILKNSSVDPDYMNVPLKFGKKIWTLRVTDKNSIPVEFMTMIISNHTCIRESTAHASFVEKIFKIKVFLKHGDGEKKLIMARYPI